ncbi:MAG: hypothetical protein RL654_1532 [Pseudomonadota bacterium]|jgi:gentisate 1,2-dioxygenase
MTADDSNRFDTLGRLEDLPQDYRDELTAQNLVPLWPSLRAVLPPHVPTRRTRVTHWPYAPLRKLLLRAGELTPIEKAERRVLVLANPGHGLEKMQASAAMYLSMQLLLPGELAPAQVLHQIDGATEVSVSDQRIDLAEAGTCAIPGYTAITLTNASAQAPSFLFIADESPLHRKLGVHEIRPNRA